MSDGVTGGRFRKLSRLGQGGSGDVWRVWDGRRGREVACKYLKRPERFDLLALKGEFRRISGLYHPNLVRLHELVEDCGQIVLTMELAEGSNFFEFVCAGSCLDETRFARAGQQLMAVVAFLHERNVLHGDLKPSNVQVVDGRVVLLDFGLATRADVPATPTMVAGTPGYLAPEALFGERSRAVDVYALGAMFRECWALSSSPLPAKVEACIQSMLSPDPALRPSLPQAYAALFDARMPEGVVRPAQFVGRRDAIARARASLETSTDRPVLLLVSGPSGIGKSAFVNQLSDEFASSGVLVLGSRVHPFESLPYNAIDGLVDELARAIEQSELEVPADTLADAAVLFPALALSPSNAVGGDTAVERGVPLSTRKRAFRAVAGLLRLASARRRVMVALDDFQWADADSVDLLAEVIRQRPPALLVVALRDGEPGPAHAALANGLLVRGFGDAVREERLAPLTLAETREWLGTVTSSLEVIDSVAAIAGGSPYLIGWLGRQAAIGGSSPSDSAVVAWLRGILSDPEWAWATCLAVAEVPVDWSVVARILGDSEVARDTFDRLVHLGVLTASLTRGEVAVAIAHDRLGQAIRATLSAAEVRYWHGRIADALSDRLGDSALRVVHLRAAGRSVEALHVAASVAQQAEAALAWHRAADLLAELTRSAPAPEVPALAVRWGTALANLGRSLDAARAFRLAAESPYASPAARLDSVTRRVEHLLFGGAFAEGIDVLMNALREQSVRLPASDFGLTLQAMWFRLRLWWRGPRPSEGIAVDDVPVPLMNLLWVASLSSGAIHPALSDALSTRFAYLALRRGRPVDVARAVPIVASTLVFFFGVRSLGRALAWFDLAERSASDEERGYLLATRGAAMWAAGRWAECVDLEERAFASFRIAPYGMSWRISMTTMYLYSAYARVGRLQRLRDDVPALHDDAVSRGDVFLETICLVGQPAWAWLLADQAEWLIDRSASVMAQWPNDRFLTQHYHHLLSRTHALMYAGRWTEAATKLEQDWERLQRSLLLSISVIAAEMWDLRGRAALGAWRHSGDSAWGRIVHLACRRLSASTAPGAPAQALALRAGVAQRAGRVAAPMYQEAERAFTDLGWPHLAEAARWRLGAGPGVSAADRPGAVAAVFAP